MNSSVTSLSQSNLELISGFLLDQVSEFVFWTDDEGKFLNANQRFCDFLGYTKSELLMMTVEDIDPDVNWQTRQQLLRELLENEQIVVQSVPETKDFRTSRVEFTIRRLVIGEQAFLCTTGREIDLEKEHRKRVLEEIAAGKPLSLILKTIVELAEATRIGMVGSILLLDEQGLLRNAASIQLSDEYLNSIDGLAPGPAIGSCGTAVFLRESVLVSDICNSHYWEFAAEFAEKENLKACWSIPIVSSKGEVLGTVAMYFRKVMVATQTDRELLKSFSLLASIAIERDHEQQQTRKNEIRYRSLVQSTMSTIWTTTPEGEFLLPQDSWESYTGQSFEEHRGNGWVNMIHKDDREKLLADWTQAMKADNRYRTQGRLWHADSKSYRHFEAFAVPVIVDGRTIEWIGCTRDVEDRQANQQLIQDKERKLKAITNALPALISYIDTQYRYQFNNAAYEHFFKCPTEELKGELVSKRLTADEFESLKVFLDRSFEGEPVRFEQPLSKFGGRPGVMELTLVPDIADGEVKGSFALAMDITERRALEKESINAATTEQRRIGQDLHDGLGQELTGLGMIADTLYLSIMDDEFQTKRIARKLTEGIKRALSQVKLLARGLNPVDVSPDGIRSAIFEMARHVEELYGIKCVVECQPGIRINDGYVATNLFRIAQEATTNSAKHGCANQISIRLAESNGKMKLEIIDDGMGIVMPEKNNRGMGLRTMKYRAGMIGARFEISIVENGGTCVECLF